jgi:hypothetical protein
MPITASRKIICVLDGGYYFRVGAAEFSVGPGTTVVVPHGSYRTFVTATGGRLLCVCAPAGHEELLLKLGRLGPAAHPERASEVWRRFATTALPGDEGRPWRRGSQ